MRPLKILNVVHRYYPSIGGSEAYAKEISERLAGDGFEVSVFTTDALDLEYFWKSGKRRVNIYKETRNGVIIERFRVIRLPLHNLTMRILCRFPFVFFKAGFSLPSPVVPGIWKRLFFNNHLSFDMVHVSAFPYNSLIYAGILFAKRHKIPVIITPFLHLGERRNDKVNRYYTRDFQLRLLGSCDRIIVQTPAERDYLRSAGIADEKMNIIGQGVNISEVTGGDARRFREKFGIPETRIVFHIANKSYDKGTFHLIEAMKEIWKGDEDVRLVLAGASMEQFDRFFSSQDGLVRKKCLALGCISDEDKKDLFAAGDVFALPSRTDSFGVVFLEAWANKKPVIGARAGGIPDVIEHEKDGYLVKFGDTGALSHCIKKLLYDKDLARAMGERGYAKVRDSLTWDIKYNRIKEVFVNNLS